ncbi:hypothetical protein KTN4_127 [Pseudomonas phage KTN4]|uniref:Uncharacterized protein n=1 Tax=Pseudomonas phage KTN4 TaxID=1862701 RepID=A0A192Y6D6_9CAUD|nr:hypothetical protein KTN4_127 [Pseudomonas phage KTN4]
MDYKLVTRNSAAWRIWNLQYMVQVPMIAGYSAEYLRKNPFNTTGDKKVDRLRTNQLETVRQTAAGLALILAEGHPIGFYKHSDCAQIYHDIQRHFQDWYDLTLMGADPNTFPPIEDLRGLEDLLMEVYFTAMKLEPQVERRSSVFDSIITMNMRRNSMATRKFLDKRVQDQKQNIKPYKSLVDEIEKYVLMED